MRLQMGVNVSVSGVAIMVVGFMGFMILGLTGCSSSAPSSKQTDTAEKPAKPSAACGCAAARWQSRQSAFWDARQVNH